MDTSTEWPWDWEEEVEWKAELEERDYEFVEGLIESAFEEIEAGSEYGLGAQEEEAFLPEKYWVAA
jgi:hypothetical protein